MPRFLTAAATERIRRFCLAITLFWFFVGGAAHFFATDFFIYITPPWVPAPHAVVLWSGALELLLAFIVWLSPRHRPGAGWALIAVIFGVSFANLHMWQHPELFPEAPRWVYTARLILQVALVWVVWFGTRVPRAQRMSPST